MIELTQKIFDFFDFVKISFYSTTIGRDIQTHTSHGHTAKHSYI